MSRLALTEVSSLRGALGGLAFGPSRLWYGEGFPDRAVDYWLDAIRSVLSNAGSVFLAHSGSRAAGLAALADQPWETRVLGRRVAAIPHLAAVPDRPERSVVLERLVEEVLRQAEDQGVECLVHRPYADDAACVHALERSGFLLVDTLLDCTYEFRSTENVPSFPSPPDLEIRLAGREDADRLAEVARLSFARHGGRFHADERIPTQSAIRVYEEWIRSCVEGWADWVFAAERRGVLIGYSAWKMPAELESRHGIALGHYSIGAVRADEEARGVFRALTEQGMRVLAGRVDRIEGPTHVSNVRVQRAYATLGWRVADARHGFHRWLRT